MRSERIVWVTTRKHGLNAAYLFKRTVIHIHVACGSEISAVRVETKECLGKWMRTPGAWKRGLVQSRKIIMRLLNTAGR